MTKRHNVRPPQVPSSVSFPWLVLAAAVSVSVWLAVEFLALRMPQAIRAQTEAAAHAMDAAHRVLWAEREARGLLPAAGVDPWQTGMIGPEFTVITTSVGVLSAKRTAAMPDFASRVTAEIARLGMAPGTPVVIVVSGSLVGANVAAIVAVEALGLRPVIVSSGGASMWGATDPDFTWFDMEEALAAAGVIRARSTVAVLGGSGGIGRGMSPDGIAAIESSIRRHGIPLIRLEPLGELIHRLVEIVDDGIVSSTMSARRDERVETGILINVGGSSIALGSCPESHVLPSGLTTEPLPCTEGTPGMAMIYAARGVPVLNLLGIRRLSSDWSIPYDPDPQQSGASVVPETKRGQ